MECSVEASRSLDGASAIQSAGVGGTGPRVVPCPGGRLIRNGNVGPRSNAGLSIGLFKLCVLAALGGGPGGGGGRGIPGSHAGDWESTGVEPRSNVMSPVDAARLAAGARLVGLSTVDPVCSRA